MRSFIIILLAYLILEGCKEKDDVPKIHIEETLLPEVESLAVAQRRNERISRLRKFLSGTKKYNSETAFFIDLKIKSNKKRFFIYDLKNNFVIDSGLVSHGSGSYRSTEGDL